MDIPDILKGLNDCCREKTCLRNLQSLPIRLVDRDLTPPAPLLLSKRKFCRSCGLPSRHMLDLEGLLDDAIDDHANVAYNCGFKPLFPGHTKDVTILYKLSNRMFQRMTQYSSCRRNVLNVIVYLPKNNSILIHHQTYRFAPQNIGTEQLLIRILKEAVGLFTDDIAEGDCPELFCSC